MRPCPHKMHFGYGERYPANLRNLTQDGRHHGQDFLTPKGTRIIACVNGVVNYKGWLRGYGLTLIIKFWVSGKTYRLILAHLSRVTTSKKIGEKVKKTDIVALTGDSGMATGHPHLHLEVQVLWGGKTWRAVNPGFVTHC
ncbi:MAG: M23 family metallopeptidase [Candidatus Saganbacteria bacterium]|nr:M23 family metallopeptidase [Candidatus Saganbacteria bacterium]